jgi:heterodisulfide reductase subunit A
MAAALQVAGQGYEVHLVEREPELGGNARHIQTTLRGNNVQRKLAEMIDAVESNPLIHVHTAAEVRQVDGFVGNFESQIYCAGNGHGPQEITVEHGVIIVATGAVERETSDYFYGQDERVVTQREMEEALARCELADEPLRSVVMIQCVESRTEEHPYCSRVCCSQALKNAIALKERDPETEVVILYRDIRSYGMREHHYQQARDLGVLFVRYDLNPDEEGRGGLPQVTQEDGALVVRAYDPISDSELELQPDRLVLSVGIGPRNDAERMAMMLKIPLNEEQFFLEAHMKLRPVEFATEGVYLAGLAHGPKFIEESIAQASAAVSRACTVLSLEQLMSAGTVAHVDQTCCVACGDCVAVCPYGATSLVMVEPPRQEAFQAAEVNPALCKACGACTAACRSGCISLDGFDDVQIMAQISAMMAY